MRVILGRVALLLGVVVVAAMAWYGANALFDESDEDDDPSAECATGTEREARRAQRAFVRQFGDQKWLVGARPTPADGDGWVLTVTQGRYTAVFGLPECFEDVPVVYRTHGPKRPG